MTCIAAWMHSFFFLNDWLDMMNCSLAVGRGLTCYPSKRDIVIWIKNASVAALITSSCVYYSSWKLEEACWSAFLSQLPYLVRKGEGGGEDSGDKEGERKEGKKQSRQFDGIGETDPSLSNTHKERERKIWLVASGVLNVCYLEN